MPRWSYTLTEPYPGKYSTHIVFVFFIFLTVLLLFVNIPLSAYIVQQSFVYNPNDTDRTSISFFSPSFFRRNPGEFTPHTFAQGDLFQTNASLFGPYTIRSAYALQVNTSNESGRPVAGEAVPNFVFYNNDLSTCDVLRITLDLVFPNQSSIIVATKAKATISCWYPSFYVLDVDLSKFVNGTIDSSGSTVISSCTNPVGLGVTSTIGCMFGDLPGITAPNITVQERTFDGSAYIPHIVTGAVSFTFEQCCATCNDALYNQSSIFGYQPKLEQYEIDSPDSNIPLLSDHPPCDDKDVMFKSSVYSDGAFRDENFVTLGSVDSLTNSTLDLPIVINNTLRAIYHGIRLDLGVIRPNQIYNSATRFNASIATLSDEGSYTSAARSWRTAIDNVDLSKSNYSVHVPVILYLTPQFKLKPMEQAITAVFVSTFTMLSAIWGIFNFVASSVVNQKETSKSGPSLGTTTNFHESKDDIESARLFKPQPYVRVDSELDGSEMESPRKSIV